MTINTRKKERRERERAIRWHVSESQWALVSLQLKIDYGEQIEDPYLGRHTQDGATR